MSHLFPHRRFAAVVSAVLCVHALGHAAEPAPFVWIEAEQPGPGSFPVKPAEAARPNWLSAGKWVFLSIDAKDVAQQVPAGGAVLKYPFVAPTDGAYEVWHRAGMEYVRSPFEWRVGAGEWVTVRPKDPKFQTIDLMELSTWNEIGWLKMGNQELKKGDHTLEIRVPIPKDARGGPDRVLYASDCFCLSAGRFHPHSKFKPGEPDRDAADEKAAEQVFALPTATAGERSAVNLNGVWEVCRHDEALPGPVAEPIADFPAEPRWKAITVPGDKNATPELLFAHRIWYRCRVDVPAALAGRSFVLTFPQNSLNTTVAVNGVPCGFGKHPYVRFDVDVTKGIKPGQVNEIRVGVRDYWYGYSASPTNPMKLREKFNLPPDFARMGFQDLAYPLWGSQQSGILVTPTLTSCGAVYAEDVFVKPSTAEKRLAAEVTLANSTSADATGEVLCEAVDPKTGAVAKALPARPFSVPAGKALSVEVSGEWTDPKLWWPDAPHLYDLRTTTKVGGKVVDVRHTTFGFRQWGTDGKHFTLNGVRWRGWNVASSSGTTPDEWLAYYRKTNQTTMRLSGATQGGPRPFFGMAPDEALDWTDRNGVPVRRCGILDGEAIGSMAVENDPELKKLYKSEIKMELMNNWVEQMAAQVRGERNHPSVQIWSIENEWLFINCINLYGGRMDEFEREVVRCTKAVRAVDPTRPVMTDGGGANKNQSMPVHGNHYVALDAPGGMTAYPGLAYQPHPTGGGRGRWVWDEKRPRYLGEDLFFTGNHPELATIGGEVATTGKSGTLPACGLLLSILQQGYRWAEYAAWDFYLGPGDADDSQWRYFAPRVALCWEWDWTFPTGGPVKRTIGLFNDTRHADPITFAWELTVGGKRGAGETKAFTVAPGMREVVEITLPVPTVTGRAEGELILTLSVGGKEVFRDTKAVSILNPTPATVSDAKALAVYDPAGTVTAALKADHVPFTAVANLKTLPEAAKVLLIGRDAVDPAESTSSRLAAFASSGRAVIVLDQERPLKFQALPAQIEATTEDGRVAFPEDTGHPVFRNLRDKDFFTWGKDERVYRNAYRKPTRGARSLLQCGDTLRNAALVEVPTGKGVMLLSQLLIGEQVEGNAAARQLLWNLIDYAARYEQVIRPATTVVGGAPLLAQTLEMTGLKSAPATDPLAALTPGGVVVLHASPANLKVLAENPAKVEAFTKSGGWLVLNGLTPEGLASYNKLVGWDHVIRPFKRERVTLPPVRRPVAAGVTGGDVTMYSSKRVFDWTEGNYVVDDEFTFVVDSDEIAPFCTSPFFAYDKIVNGFTNADGWPLVINFPLNKDRSPSDVVINFPREETVTEFTWIGNTNYWPQTKIELIFDGDTKDVRSYDVKPNGDPQVLAVAPARKAKQMTLRIAGWREVPGKGPLIGIDNIYIKVRRPAEFYERVKPLVNVGGMMEYPRGAGGIVLCNLNFKATEEVPLNADKKRAILAAVLRNLNAPFAGRTVIAGANLEYRALDLSQHATAFRDDKGWFGDKKFTFRDLPTGIQTMAGVPYDVYGFATSPVPTVVVLDGPGVPGNLPKEVKGIPVNRKADAVFFLMAARIDRRRNPNEVKNGTKLELARFVVRYADGKVDEVPVYAELQIENYPQKTPAAVPGAQTAWTRPYEGTDQSAVAYSLQWTNPRPDAEIKSIDLLPGKDKAGVPALLALTAASAR
ncbi:glycoside hydrolase family 2 TIM barrel-domain containing protein [Frigoriglobus tundricola]|uniref:Retaining glycoside hydrolase n=1 Tax=Frigoriglobus tundricola TaxID=2774151 RepID=A0A6M5Z060_9BACT|nr:glycoside hydrolase family 2 TIM barrel-domain containing protein [Frigoriglobus tundricola]QJW98863.1 retaining glycoside hydrolase [Frigoriglobus tundricola]